MAPYTFHFVKKTNRIEHRLIDFDGLVSGIINLGQKPIGTTPPRCAGCGFTMDGPRRGKMLHLI